MMSKRSNNNIKISSSYNKIHSRPKEMKAFPLVKICDNARLLPKYMTVLNRRPEEGVLMDDLDVLQHELEKLLSVCCIRDRLMRHEIDYIDKSEEKRDKRGKLFDRPPSPKRRKHDEKLKISKLEKTNYKVMKARQNTFLTQVMIDDFPKAVEVPKVSQPKNDMPNKFWLSIDPFCAPISRDDITYLDGLIAECRASAEMKLEVGPVGNGYTFDWGKEDPVTAPEPKFRLGDVARRHSDSLITQRILSSLMEEKVFAFSGAAGLMGDMRPLLSRPGICFESRLRRELAEHGLLDAEDVNRGADDEDGEPGDELAAEMRRVHNELVSVSEQNVRELNRLRTLLECEMTRQDIRSRLDQVDQQLLEAYARLRSMAVKSKWRKEDVHAARLTGVTPEDADTVKLIKLQIQLQNELNQLTDPKETKRLRELIGHQCRRSGNVNFTVNWRSAPLRRRSRVHRKPRRSVCSAIDSDDLSSFNSLIFCYKSPGN